MIKGIIRKLAFAFTALLLASSFAHAEKKIDPALLQPDNLFPVIKFETSMGDILVELDRPKAPVTVENFLKYVVTGEYDNTLFHRVIADFVVQGGGLDDKYNHLEETFGSIVNEAGNGIKNEEYTIAMARQSHPHSAGRQFYFNANDNKSLDPGPRSWGYAVFGRVTAGEEVVDKISEVPTEFNAKLSWPDVPVTPVILKKVSLLPEDV